MWFSLKPTSKSDDKEEFPLLLKEITTLKLSNPKVPITPKKRLPLFWSKSLPIHIFS